MDKNGKPRYNEVVFSDEQVQEIIDLYVNHKESSVKIGKKFGVSHKGILKVLHRNNIELMPGALRRKYTLNEHYFDCIDSPNKAYILGLLYADGHNEIKKGTVTISLQEEDGDLLEQINHELESNRPLEYLDYSNKHDFGYHYKNQYRLSVFSQHMCDTLSKLGMVSNKSLVLEFPNIPHELYSHFIRGYFDGDGSINKKGGSFGILSTLNFVLKVKEIFESEIDVHFGIITESSCKNGITHDLRFCRKAETAKIWKWLYSDAQIYLRRKYKTYCDVFGDDAYLIVC